MDAKKYQQFSPDFLYKENIFLIPLIVSVISKDPGNEQISTSRCDEIFLFFLTPNIRGDIEP